MLTTVTITGADDRVDPWELARLSEEFPHVEWGVLISTGRAGTPRYPSTRWIRRLNEMLRHREMSMSCAAHLCGKVARDLAEGDEHEGAVAEFFLTSSRFDRAQLNNVAPMSTEGFARLAARLDQEIILQAKSEDALPTAWEHARAVLAAGGRASVLFDPSGGRGLEPFRWPPPFCYDEVQMGYAGGIGPDNVEEVVGEILMGGPSENFWIDMESGVRDEEDRFDLGRVRAVLERTARFVR